MSLFMAMDTAAVAPEHSRPDPSRLIHGAPEFTTWNLEQAEGGVWVGFWQSTPGKWRVEYTEWEYCCIRSGISIVTEVGGEACTVKAGDSFVLRPGFKGTWEVVETTLKEYVIRE